MNERIEKLALKFANRTGNSVLVNAEIFKEFAELIVQECISVADLPKNPSGQWNHLESSEVIKEYFGIQE